MIFDPYAQYLFFCYCSVLRPTTICDVGSRNGRESLIFRSYAPDSRIVAFEANPADYEKMAANGELNRADIRVEHKAVSDTDGTLTFYSVEKEKGAGKSVGASSLHYRDNGREANAIEVPAVTLDDYFAGQTHPTESYALWIDVEGAAYEVLAGGPEVLRRTQFLQVEVETEELWSGQKTKREIDALLEEAGFVGLLPARRGKKQMDAFYVKRSVLEIHRGRLDRCLRQARMISAARRVLPASLKHGEMQLLKRMENSLRKL